MAEYMGQTMIDYRERNRQRREKRKRQRRRRMIRRLLLLLVVTALVVTAVVAGRSFIRNMPRDYYTAKQLKLPTVTSDSDADGDGIDDLTDIMLGARAYIETNPHYQSAYYDGGYPNDGCGVCTDVVWHGFQEAGYSLKTLIDADIAAHPEAYPQIKTPDSNIDFRRVDNLDSFFSRHAQVLTCSLEDPAQWQAGDIVTFNDGQHVAICSDKRTEDGIPWIIHHGNPRDEAVEKDQMGRFTVTGHYRWIPQGN